MLLDYIKSHGRGELFIIFSAIIFFVGNFYYLIFFVIDFSDIGILILSFFCSFAFSTFLLDKFKFSKYFIIRILQKVILFTLFSFCSGLLAYFIF